MECRLAEYAPMGLGGYEILSICTFLQPREVARGEMTAKRPRNHVQQPQIGVFFPTNVGNVGDKRF